MSYLTLFIAGFLSVFAAGFQSRNVNTGRRKSAMATSMLIALSQGTVIVQIASASDWTSKIIYGLSGACGIWCAMEAHDQLHAPGSRLDAFRKKRHSGVLTDSAIASPSEGK